MKRLTKRTETGVAYLADPITLRSSMEDRGKVHTMIDRLADYEDTGLEPEQAAALKAYTERKAVMMVTEIDGMPIDRVRELVAAEQEGRLVVLPCKVGDSVYVTDIIVGKIVECEVISFDAVEGNEDFLMEYKLPSEIPEIFSQIVPSGEIGKTVFLTREEAEKALRGGSSDDP